MNLKEQENALLSKLIALKDEAGCIGLKSEFENEASEFTDLILLRYITAKAGLKFFIKIGGVEAFSDLKLCIHLNADGVIVPMVESKFALIKSQNMITDILGNDFTNFDVVINIETKTAIENLESIISAFGPMISGVTIGRSDLSYSYDCKGQQDSDFTNSKVLEIAEKVKKHDRKLRLTVGGGISQKTYNNQYFANKLAPMMDNIETRNVILSSSCIKNPANLQSALDFEKSYLVYKLEKNKIFTKLDEKRFITLNSRG